MILWFYLFMTHSSSELVIDNILEQVMNAAFRDIAHASVATEATGIKTNNHFNMSMAEVDELAKTVNQVVSTPDLSFNSLLKNHNSVMNKYLSSWESWRRG